MADILPAWPQALGFRFFFGYFSPHDRQDVSTDFDERQETKAHRSDATM
jgi:hypothetical protein